jgi:hypothetical protein
MNPLQDLRDIGYVIMWSITGLTLLACIVYEIKESAFQSGYWKGRSDGWKVANRHRDLTDANNN